MGQLIICKRVDFLLNHFSLTVFKFGYVNSEATIMQVNQSEIVCVNLMGSRFESQ